MDKISVDRVQLLHPAVRESAMKILKAAETVLTGNAVLRYAYTMRTWAEQTALFAIGRTVPGKKVTDAPAGKSWHNYGLAFDIVLIVDGKTASWDTLKDFDGDKKADWMEIVALAKAEGWEWGGDWRKLIDKPHFQKVGGLTIAEALERHKKRDFIPGTEFIRI